MGMPATSLVISKKLRLEDIAWPRVLERMAGTFKIDFFKADEQLKHFLIRLRRPFNLAWFISQSLSLSDNIILSCVCEVHGADTIELWYERSIHLGPLAITYFQESRFTPKIPRGTKERRGTGETRIVLGFLSKRLEVQSFLCCLGMQFLFFSLGVFLYVLIGGLLIYGLSVFILFLHHPISVLRSALHNPKIGLALLGFLSAIAAISGRAIANVSRLLWRRLASIRKR